MGSDGGYLSRRAGDENFPVALRVLPAALRRHLRAVYDVARVIDDLGDAAAGDRTAALLAFRADLSTIWHGGTPAAGVLRSLAPAVAACGLPEQPFVDLIEANLRDQTTVAYETYDELLGYCALSANPVGRLVLLIFGVSTPTRVELADRICSALQIIEHCQDVAEDYRSGRRYLPGEDLRRFVVAPADLGADQATPAVRALLRFEAGRAEALLRSGAPLVGDLHGWARLAVAGYVAGGLAAVQALRRGNWSPLPTHPPRRRRDVLLGLTALLLRTRARPIAPELDGPARRAGVTVDEAYRICEQITRDQARNFHYGIRLLPGPRRQALCALYALARRIDDIGDGDLPVPAKVQALTDVRAGLRDLADSGDPVLLAVHDASRRYPVPLAAFDELVDGVEMDVTGRHYETFDDLVSYCRCVAGTVGRLCLGVFAARPDPRASDYADRLGIALQQTNILRDIREDLTNGRVYLPQRELDAFGVALTLDERGALVDKDGGLAALIVACAKRARGWYDEGLRLLPLLDRRSAACTAAMAGIYQRLLDRVEQQPQAVYDRRLSLSGWQKARVATWALVGRSAR